MIYYISDTHFRDQAIFDKCKRPFKSLDEMESTFISKWNNKVNCSVNEDDEMLIFTRE